MSDPLANQPIVATARYNVLKGPGGLRARWRLLIFFVILLPVEYGASKISESVTEGLHAGPLTPVGFTIFFGILVCALLLVTWIMARIEDRSFADYGLPWRRAFCLRFWLTRMSWTLRTKPSVQFFLCPQIQFASKLLPV